MDSTSNKSRTDQFMDLVASGQQVLARTELPGEVIVSTVRLMDDSKGARWNTLVMGGPLDDVEDGYRTVAEAVAGHEAMVARVQADRGLVQCKTCGTWMPAEYMVGGPECRDYIGCQIRAGVPAEQVQK